MDQIWSGLPSGFEAAYVRDYHRVDPWVEASRSTPLRLPKTTFELLPAASIRTSPFLQEIWSDARLGDLLGVKLLERSERLSSFSLVRALGDRPFDERERRRLARLVPALEQAARAYEAMRAMESTRAALLATLERADLPVMLISLEGKIEFASAAALALTKAPSGVQIREGRLCLKSKAASRAWHNALALARAGHPPPSLHLGPALELELLCPTAGAGPLVATFRATRASDPLASYGLTPAERRLAKTLADGHTLADAARAFHVSLNTVRTQLQAIFHKTGTHRQAELVRLLARSG
ncbi:MAG: helix-turn-helix transcriptional regulator [Myxococcota bacterium]